MPRPDTKVQFAMRVPPEYIERLDVLAEKMGLDRAEVARRALRNGIDGLETVSNVVGNPVAEKVLQLLTVLESDKEDREEIRRVLRSVGQHTRQSKAGVSAGKVAPT